MKFTDVRILNLDLNKILKKYGNTKSLYIIIIIGVVLMLLSSGSEPKNDTSAPAFTAYSDEERLRDILSKIDGAGEVFVMITYHGTTTYDVAYEKKETRSERSDETTKNEENSVIKNGNEPLVKGEVYPKVKGVIIIAEGASVAEVKKNICDAAVAALDVAPYRVCVLEGKERN